MKNSNQTKKIYHGSCLCNAVQYELDDLSDAIAHCHCRMCRKFHGAAFSTFGSAKVADFRWIKGQEYIKTYLASNGTQRKFCSQCGSSLVFVPSNDHGEMIEFTLGTLDTECTLQANAHIFTNFSAHWFPLTTINDQLPQFTEGRTSALKSN